MIVGSVDCSARIPYVRVSAGSTWERSMVTQTSGLRDMPCSLHSRPGSSPPPHEEQYSTGLGARFQLGNDPCSRMFVRNDLWHGASFVLPDRVGFSKAIAIIISHDVAPSPCQIRPLQCSSGLSAIDALFMLIIRLRVDVHIIASSHMYIDCFRCVSARLHSMSLQEHKVAI